MSQEGNSENFGTPFVYPDGDYTEKDVRDACYAAARGALERAKALGASDGWMYSPTERARVGLTKDEAMLVLDWIQDEIGK